MLRVNCLSAANPIALAFAKARLSQRVHGNRTTFVTASDRRDAVMLADAALRQAANTLRASI